METPRTLPNWLSNLGIRVIGPMLYSRDEEISLVSLGSSLFLRIRNEPSGVKAPDEPSKGSEHRTPHIERDRFSPPEGSGKELEASY